MIKFSYRNEKQVPFLASANRRLANLYLLCLSKQYPLPTGTALGDGEDALNWCFCPSLWFSYWKLLWAVSNDVLTDFQSTLLEPTWLSTKLLHCIAHRGDRHISEKILSFRIS